MENQEKEFKEIQLTDIKCNAPEHIEGTPFTVVDMNSGYILTMGNNVISPNKFESVEDAKTYVESKPYYLIMAMTNVLINHKKE